MKKTIFLLSLSIAFSLTNSSAQLAWDNSSGGVNTHTTENVGIGWGVTAPPTDATLYSSNLEILNVQGISDVNFRILRTISPPYGMGGHTSGNLIEAIVNDDGNVSTGFVLTSKFKMGIGTNNPIDRLDVSNGNISLTNNDFPKVKGFASKGKLSIFANQDINNGPAIEMFGPNSTTTPGNIDFTNFGDRSEFTFSKNYAGTFEKQITFDGQGDIWMTRLIKSENRNFYGTASEGALNILGNTSSQNGGAIELYGDQHPTRKGNIHFVTRLNSDPNEAGFNFINFDGSTYNSLFQVQKNGNLWVNGDVNFNPSQGWSEWSINGNNDYGRMTIYGGSSSTTGAGIELIGVNNSTYSPGVMYFVANSPFSNEQISYNYQVCSTGNFNSTVRFYNNGKVAIGDIGMSRPDGYRLYVEEGILTQRLKVAVVNSGDWSDYVFANDYQLKSLSEVETFINENKHLPDVPSAAEVVADGIDVAKMDAKLLQKIEELTLYIIEQNKRIEILESKINKTGSK